MSTYYQSDLENDFCKLTIKEGSTRSNTAIPTLRLRKGIQTRETTSDNNES